MISQNWTREQIAWLAGLWEGEGCFTMSNTKGRIQLRAVLTTTDQDVAERSYGILGLGSLLAYDYDNSKQKRVYNHYISRADDVYAMCMVLYPFLCSRRQERIRDLTRVYIQQDTKSRPRRQPRSE